jgi:hypothetical protein
MFRRKKWKYLILDEAHMIKNWRSQRWQTLLNFNSKRRVLSPKQTCIEIECTTRRCNTSGCCAKQDLKKAAKEIF